MGGMAEVFRAHGNGADGFRKEVCIKRILPQFCEDEDFVRMFKDEAKLAARLSHANIVQIFDFDQVDGSYFIAMEYVAGKDLRTVIRVGFQKGQPPGIYRACTLVAEMCKGLHHAHQKDGLHLVHRDVSPHNVLVSMAGEVKVMDFGIAKATDRITRTSTGIIKGKIAYMAPEQAAGGELDHRVDQFATGLVFYELLTGRKAYTGDSVEQITSAVLNNHPAPAHEVRPGVSPTLSAIAARAMARDPAARYASAAEMATELRRWVDRHSAVETAADRAELPAPVRPAPRTARNRALWLGASLLAGSLVLAVSMRLREGAAPTLVPTSAAPVATASPVPPAEAQTSATAATPAAGGEAAEAALPAPAAAPATAGATPARATPQRSAAGPRPRSDSSVAARETRPAAAAVLTGSLQLAISPWGTVEVDGAPAGTTPPLTRLSLAEGTHTVTVRNADFPPYTTTVQVSADKPVTCLLYTSPSPRD